MQSPKQLHFSSSWTNLSSFFSVLIWLLKYIFFLPQFQLWHDFSKGKIMHFPTKQQIFVRILNTLSFWKIPDNGLIDRECLKGRIHFCIRNGSPQWLCCLASLWHIEEVFVSELLYAKQCLSCFFIKYYRLKYAQLRKVKFISWDLQCLATGQVSRHVSHIFLENFCYVSFPSLYCLHTKMTSWYHVFIFILLFHKTQ